MRSLTVLFGLLLVWAILVRVLEIPHYFLPSPEAALFKLFERPQYFAYHAWITCIEIVLGCLFGLSAGVGFGLLLVAFRRLEPWFWPLLVASQAIPVFAIGPLLALWLGYSISMRVTMAALIIFFPVAVSARYALSQKTLEVDAMLHAMNANPLRAFWHVRLPMAFKVFAPGLLIATATAPIGAIVGEWIGSSHGLGHVMLDANAKVQTDTMIAALFVLCLMAYGFFAAVQALVKRAGWWFQT